MRCVSYTRFTSWYDTETIPSDIIQQQNEIIDDFAKANNWRITKHYSDRKNDRKAEKAFLEMKQDGMLHKFDMVVLSSVSRCGFNIAVMKNLLLDVFYKTGVHFAIADDNICSLQMTQKDVEEYLNRVYKNNLSIKSLQFHSSQRMKGLFTVHDEKYGYLLSSDRTELVVDPEAAPVIREMFELIAQGYTQREIVRIFTEKGYECPAVHAERVFIKHPKAQGRNWSISTISDLHKCTHYIGYAYKMVNHERIKVTMPPIVDKELFEKAEAVMQSKYTYPSKVVRPFENHFRHLIKDKSTGIPLLCTNASPKNPQRILYLRNGSTKNNILYETVISEVKKLLSQEASLAKKAEEKLQTEDAEIALAEQSGQVIQGIKDLIDEVSEAAKRRIELMNYGDASSEDELDALEERFQALEVKTKEGYQELDDIDLAFSKNPWILKYKDFDPNDTFDDSTVKNLIDMVWVEDFTTVTLSLKEQKWKEMLPTEWFTNGEDHGANQ